MKRLAKKVLHSLWRGEEGQDLVEYTLLMVLVALGAIATIHHLAEHIERAFGRTAEHLAPRNFD